MSKKRCSRCGRGPGRGTDLTCARLELARDDMGDVVKGGGNAGGGIERAGAAMEQDAHGQAGHILHGDVVALLLALAEDGDGLALGSLAAKPVRPVARMWIARAVDEGRAQRREGPSIFAAEHQLTCSVHHAVDGRGSHRRALGDRVCVVGVDRVGADVDAGAPAARPRTRQSRPRPCAGWPSAAPRSWQARRPTTNTTASSAGEPGLELIAAAGPEQVHLLARQSQRGNVAPCEFLHDGATDHAAGADHDGALRLGGSTYSGA